MRVSQLSGGRPSSARLGSGCPSNGLRRCDAGRSVKLEEGCLKMQSSLTAGQRGLVEVALPHPVECEPLVARCCAVVILCSLVVRLEGVHPASLSAPDCGALVVCTRRLSERREYGSPWRRRASREPVRPPASLGAEPTRPRRCRSFRHTRAVVRRKTDMTRFAQRTCTRAVNSRVVSDGSLTPADLSQSARDA